MSTQYIDTAQLVLYAFWFFFAGLVFYLRREDRREGYPLESDKPYRVGRPGGGVMIPAPKTFLHPDGHTVSQAPDFKRDTRPLVGERVAGTIGAPIAVGADPLLSAMGPASYCERHDEVEKTTKGEDCIVPLRVAKEFAIDAGPDPRGWNVVAGDGKVAGTVKDLWIDRADQMVRYVEVDVPGKGVRLVPFPLALVCYEPDAIQVASIYAGHFEKVPVTKEPDRITGLEEEKISAFYAGGRLYADPKRAEPLV
jgi:photosynthetic reaction center H subunit